MATEKYEVLVKIGIDSKVVQDSIANADRLTAEITKLREAQKASGVQDAETTAAIKALTQERSRDLRVVQQANTLASETVKGQERLKAELSLLTVQYNNLTTAEQKTTESGQKMGARIRALSDELKANESAVGNNTRNVGNYTDSIKEALVSITGAVPGLKGFKGGLDGVTNGFKAAGGGVKGFGAALMSLGLPLIIAGVTALIGIFKTFTPIVDAVENAVTGLKAAFGALVSGGNITEAVKQSQALLNVMRDLEDTEKAFSIQAQRMENEVAKLIVQSKDRTKTDQERLAILKQANELEEKYHKASIARVNEALGTAQAKFMSDNKINAAQMKLLAEGTSAQAIALRERLEKNVGVYNAEELIAIQDQIAKKTELDGKSLVLQEKLTNRTNQLLDQAAQEKQKAVDAEIAATEKANEARQKEQDKKDAIAAKELEDAKKQADELKKIANDFMRSQMSDTDRQLLEIGEKANVLRAAGVEEVAITKFINDEVKKIEDIARAEKLAKDGEAFTKQIELLGLQEQIEVQAAETSIKNEKELTDAKAKIALDYLAQKLAIMQQMAMLDGIATAEEIANLKLVEGEIKRITEGLANPEVKPATLGQMLGLTETDIEDIQLAMEVVDGLLATAMAATQASADNRLAQIDAQSTAEIQAINNSTLSEEQKAAKIKTIEQKAARDKYKIELEQFKIAQALQIAMAIANTATAVMAQLSNPTPYAGFVLAALAGVTGAAQIAMIASQQPPPPPAFASGGYVSGAGSGTSDSIPAMLSNGESVNNAETTRRFAPLLSSLNAAGGGVDWYRGEGFASGGLVRKFATGGVAMSSSSMIRENQQVAMMAAQMSMSQPVLVIEEFQSVQGRQVRTEQNLQL
jgi:hypothetical protein